MNRLAVIVTTLFMIASREKVFAASPFKLSQKCPSTGLYQDDNGLCRPVQPYTKDNGRFHGLWKLHSRDIKLRPQVIDLGRMLFFDPVLSGQQNIACSSCHEVEKAFSGEKDQLRNAPGLINLAYSRRFFWDGRETTAEGQLRAPLISQDEMGNSSIDAVLARINQIDEYRRLFAEVRTTGKASDPVTWVELVEALDSFQKSLITFTAPYDRYVLGDQQALSPAQVRGLILFRSFATRCAECHTPPLFTNQEVLTIGAPGEHRAFRVPTLRQIAKTGPYMHRGAFASLGEVVHFYNQGGGRSSQGVSGRSTHWHVRPIGMGPDDERDLVAFLGALTDDGWMVDIPQRVPSGLKPTAR